MNAMIPVPGETADDRLFPLEFQRRGASERLGVNVDAIKSGHLVALSNPRGLTKLLLRYATQAH